MLKILLCLLFLDSIYLFLHQRYFQKVFTKLQHSSIQVRPFPVILVYVLLVLLIQGAMKYKLSNRDVFLLGICVYGVYEGTNYAVLRDWPLYLFLVDTLWGGILLYLTYSICK